MRRYDLPRNTTCRLGSQHGHSRFYILGCPPSSSGGSEGLEGVPIKHVVVLVVTVTERRSISDSSYWVVLGCNYQVQDKGHKFTRLQIHLECYKTNYWIFWIIPNFCHQKYCKFLDTNIYSLITKII